MQHVLFSIEVVFRVMLKLFQILLSLLCHLKQFHDNFWGSDGCVYSVVTLQLHANEIVGTKYSLGGEKASTTTAIASHFLQPVIQHGA